MYNLYHYIASPYPNSLAIYHQSVTAVYTNLYATTRHQDYSSAPKAGLSSQTQEPRLQFYER